MCRAANALQIGRFNWLELALNDTDLQQVILAWYTLPVSIKAAIAVLVSAARH